MRETEHAASSTIRRRLAALSSLYRHLVRHRHAARNPVGEVERPAINRDEGSTLAFAKTQARKLLDIPAEDTIAGLRDRAILSVGLQVGLRRAEIAALTVGDLHQNRGYSAHSMRHVYHHGARKWRAARRRAEGRRPPRPEHDQALRSAGLQPREGGKLFCDLLSERDIDERPRAFPTGGRRRCRAEAVSSRRNSAAPSGTQ